MDIDSSRIPQHVKEHLSDGFVVGSLPRGPPRSKCRDSRSHASDGLANGLAHKSFRERRHGLNDFVPQVRNHRRSSAVRIEVDEHLRRRSLPKDSTQRESPLFHGRLEAFLETCVEIAGHEKIAEVMKQHVDGVLKESMAQKETCCEVVAELEEDLETLRACRRDLEKETARIFQRTTGGSISDLADTEERQNYDLRPSSAHLRKDSTRQISSDDRRAAQDCPVQCADVSIVSALSSVFYRSPPSAFDSPPESPIESTSDMALFGSAVAPSDPFRFTNGSATRMGGANAYGESPLPHKAQLMQRPLGEHLFLPGVQIDKHATIEQALADARFMNQLLPSHAMEQQDSARMVSRLLRLVDEVEVDISALRQAERRRMSRLEPQILRMSTYSSGKLNQALKSFDNKFQERQSAAWIGLIETASLESGCNPTAALQSTLRPAIVRCATSAALPACSRTANSLEGLAHIANNPIATLPCAIWRICPFKENFAKAGSTLSSAPCHGRQVKATDGTSSS